MRDQYYVYIMANKRPTRYTGVTHDLIRRVYEHKHHLNKDSFTAKYFLHNLVYYEICRTPEAAITRENEIKHMKRKEKLDLITGKNPDFKDLYEEII